MKTFYKIFGSLSLSFLCAVTASAATLSLSPATKTVNVGETFTVTVVLNTQSQPIDGVDLQAVNYNPYNLQVVDADPNTSGVQISAGTLMPNTLANSVDTTNGKIVFSQVTSGGSTYTGSGTLATITFKALVAGTANVTFSYTAAATTDSNISSAGTDILTAVTNGQFIINNVSASAGAIIGLGGSVSITNPTNQNQNTPNQTAQTSPSSVSAAVLAKLVSLTLPLGQGISNSQVTSLQTVLSLQGYLASNLATGYYGALTEAAVKKYQCDKSIVCSGTPLTTGYGKIGPSTRSALNSAIALYVGSGGTATGSSSGQSQTTVSGSLSEDLFYGSSGAQVSILQTLLAKDSSIYPEGVINGLFGPATQRAVRRFQTKYNIVGSASASYGRVGPATRAKLTQVFGQ